MPADSNLFPLGIATGAAHCDRNTERSELLCNIRTGTHTWLWGYRRVGKTSLVAQVLRDIEMAGHNVIATNLDLLVVHDIQGFEALLRAAVERLGSQLGSGDRRATEKLAEAFSRLKPEFALGSSGLSVKLTASQPPAPAVSEALVGLDRAAGMSGTRVVIVLDEFQQLGRLKPVSARLAMEGAIRHAAERADHVTYVFSGSEKHLLASMFEDDNRPLYRLCRKITLDRIGESDYRDFLQRACHERWGLPITDAAIGAVLALTARHPHYVNALCGRLWNGEGPPTAAAVESAWTRIVDEQGRVAATRIARLPASQRALLRAVAQSRAGVEHLTSHEFLAPLRLPTSTAGRARELLEQDEFIRRDDNGRWILVDPVMAAYLRRI